MSAARADNDHELHIKTGMMRRATSLFWKRKIHLWRTVRLLVTWLVKLWTFLSQSTDVESTWVVNVGLYMSFSALP